MPLTLSSVIAAVLYYYSGEDPAERAAARTRENAELDEAADAPIVKYLLLMVRARWLGLTGRDRRSVQLIWVGLTAMLAVVVAIPGLDIQGIVTGVLIAPVLSAVGTIMLIFRM